MKNLTFNEGRERFRINGDPNRVISFNPADPELLNRILGIKDKFADYRPADDIELNPDGTPKGNLEKGAAYIAEFTKLMRITFNGVFNADVYDMLFDGQSPLCIVGQKYLFEEIVDTLAEVVNPAIEAYNRKAKEKMEKYLEDLEE